MAPFLHLNDEITYGMFSILQQLLKEVIFSISKNCCQQKMSFFSHETITSRQFRLLAIKI